jgi:hypothetical protein
MRLVWRYILNGLSVLSLVLCVATAGLWARSYRHADSYYWLPESRRVSINSGGGYVWWDSQLAIWDSVFGPEPEGWTSTAGACEIPRCLEGRFGIGWTWTSGRRFAVLGRRVVVPDGYLVGAFFVLPFTSLVMRLRRRAATKTGLCFKCGYDLRATPNRCPECGTIRAEVMA